MRIACVAGARPNFMKVKPVMDALESRGARVDLVHTGQHYDDALSEVFFRDLGIRAPDHWLGAGSGSHAEQTAAVMVAFEKQLETLAPDVVVVVGDVNSTVAASLVGAKAGSLVAHVEAGLRSRDWTMPEEINRVVTDRVSDYLFASAPDAAVNLRAEGYREDQIHLVGNVMVDTLLANLERARQRHILADLGIDAHGYGLVTLHRPSNVDDIGVFEGLVSALGTVSGRLPLVFPVHPRTKARIEGVGAQPGLCVIDPVGYLDFIALEANARLVLTDSGGVQEETTVLGVPCLTIRANTERPITITEGTNRLVGCDPSRIVEAVDEVLSDGVVPRRPALWDGHAGERIADVILSGGGPADHRRPTDLAT